MTYEDIKEQVGKIERMIEERKDIDAMAEEHRLLYNFVKAIAESEIPSSHPLKRAASKIMEIRSFMISIKK